MLTSMPPTSTVGTDGVASPKSATTMSSTSTELSKQGDPKTYPEHTAKGTTSILSASATSADSQPTDTHPRTHAHPSRHKPCSRSYAHSVHDTPPPPYTDTTSSHQKHAPPSMSNNGSNKHHYDRRNHTPHHRSTHGWHTHCYARYPALHTQESRRRGTNHRD